jgi:hypothetical protein
MVRAVKYALVAVAVLASGCIALLTASDADAQPAAPAKLSPQPMTSAAPVSAPVVRALPVVVPAPAPSPAAVTEEKDAFRNWSPAVATLPKDLGQMGPSLKLALDDARNKDMAFCFRDLEKASEASEDGAAAQTIRATDLVLYIETRDGAADVVEAKVARPGTLPASVVDCARDVLRGLEVKVFFAEPGTRYSYLYEIEA